MTASGAETGQAPLPRLVELAGAIERHPAGPDLYAQAARAVFAALKDPEGLAGWDEQPRHALYRQLLRHIPCPAPMLSLAHEAASNLTSGNADAVRMLVAELAPVIKAELDTDPAQNPGFKNVVVFALTIRAVAGDWLDRQRLSRLHLEWFDRFTPDDLALPYSVMFNPDLFGQNRAELLAAHWPDGDTGRLQDKAPDTVLFFSWLAGRDAFQTTGDLSAYLDRHLPGSDLDRAGARALLLRSGQFGSEPDQLAAWGLSDLAPLLGKVAARMSTRPAGQPDRRGARYLQNRPYQALHAARNRYAPFLAGRGKPRVAICLSGQLRGYEAALATWRRTLLRGMEPVFFIHSWTGIGRSDAQPFRYVLPFAGKAFPKAYRQVALELGYDEMRARYPSLFAALADGNQVTAGQLQAAYGTDHVTLDEDTDPRFATFTNQQKMHYKIHAADRMARAAGGFDLHIRLRPDLAAALVGFDWRDLSSACAARSVIFAEKPYGLHYNTLMIGDQCAVGHPGVMQIYADTWQIAPELAQADLARCPAEFTGHASLAMTSWMHGIAVDRLPVRFGTLQEARPLPLEQARSALLADSRNDTADQLLLEAVNADLAAG